MGVLEKMIETIANIFILSFGVWLAIREIRIYLKNRK